MRIQMSGCSQTTSSLSHRDSSRHVGRTRSRRPPVTARLFLVACHLILLVLVVVSGLVGSDPAWAQTPTTPSDPTQQQPGQPPQEQQPQEPSPQPPSPTPEPGLLTPAEQQQLIQQYQQQGPLGAPITPATPPSVTIP